MRKNHTKHTHRSWISLPLLMLSLSGAQAEEPLPPAKEPARSLLSAQMTDPYRSSPVQTLDAQDWQPVRLRKGGVEVRRQLLVGDHPIEMRLKGPLMKHKRLGVKFEVRF